VLKQLRPDGSSAEMRYNIADQMTSVVDPLGRQSILWCDPRWAADQRGAIGKKQAAGVVMINKFVINIAVMVTQ
jgi:hypothetical protein